MIEITKEDVRDVVKEVIEDKMELIDARYLRKEVFNKYVFRTAGLLAAMGAGGGTIWNIFT